MSRRQDLEQQRMKVNGRLRLRERQLVKVVRAMRDDHRLLRKEMRSVNKDLMNFWQAVDAEYRSLHELVRLTRGELVTCIRDFERRLSREDSLARGQIVLELAAVQADLVNLRRSVAELVALRETVEPHLNHEEAKESLTVPMVRGLSSE